MDNATHIRITGGPEVVEFTYHVNARGGTPTPTHEVVIRRVYERMMVLRCDCARVVRPNRQIVVWHSLECPEADS